MKQLLHSRTLWSWNSVTHARPKIKNFRGIGYRAGAISAQPGNVQPWWIRYSLVLFQQERDFDSLAFLRRLQSKFEGVGEVGTDTYHSPPPTLCSPPRFLTVTVSSRTGTKSHESIACRTSALPFSIWIRCTMTYRNVKILVNCSSYAVVGVGLSRFSRSRRPLQRLNSVVGISRQRSERGWASIPWTGRCTSMGPTSRINSNGHLG